LRELIGLKKEEEEEEEEERKRLLLFAPWRRLRRDMLLFLAAR
jgi:hypothetical protein